MKKLLSIIVLIICLGVSGQSNAQCTDRPIINDFTPKTGFIGSTVTITGANFNATPANNQVFFGATQATIESSSFGTLVVRVPEGSTTALISVKNHCNKTAYSKTHFNGIFCPTPLTNTSYQNVTQELTGIYGAYNMLSQDMDNDGKPEVISARHTGGITIAINNSTPGTINFTRYNQGATGGYAQSIAVADFDGDGLKDIVTNRAIMRNTSTGIGNFGLQYVTHSRNVSNYQVGTGDFNNDGKIDIIGEYGNWIYVAFNTSTGPGNFNFTNRIAVKHVGTRCTGIQVADVDGDGKTDFLASQGGANRAVSIRNTTANGSFTASFENPEYWSSGGLFPYRAMIADFDKDGKIDFTSCNYNGTTNTAIWRNTSTVGNISFAGSVNISSPRNNYRIGVGDVDGDGYPDIVTKSLGVNVFSVYKNTSSGAGSVTFAPRIDYTSSSRAEVSGIVIGDLDGDFVPDIATSGISSNTIRFHRNTGAQNDTTPPTVACRNITVALSPNGTVSITPEMIDNGSGDACGIESLTLSETNFTCANIGENTVTLTATDGAGNTSSCTATVNVQPAAIIVAGQSTVCQGETVEMNANQGDSYQWKKDGVNIPGATNQNYTASTSGDYTVVVTNAGGCSGESLVTPVVVNENPTVDVSPNGNAFLCPPNNSTTLTASQSSIYQWMKDGVDIANATQQTYEATSVGTYSVRVIDLFGCSAISEGTTITANPAEIEVTGDGNYGNVFPNQNYTKTITISNTGTGSLDITNLAISGADAASFSLSGFSTPGSVTAGNSVTVDVIFNAPNITTYSAQLSFNSNDCDEGTINIPLNAEITCVAAGFGAFPSNMNVNTDSGICGATVNYTAEATGNPASTLTYTFSGATTGNGNGSGTGALFNVGTTTVTLNSVNPCGNVTQSFDVVVTDNEAPVIQGQNTNLDMNFDTGVGNPPSYTEDGITFLSLYGSSSHVHLGDNDNDGSNDILNHSGCCSTPYRLTVGAGTEFTLVSMNVKRVSGNPTFSVFPSGASVTISSTGVFTFPAGFENVTEVRWNQNSGIMVIDDMVVSTTTAGQCPADISVSSDPGACGTNVSFSANAIDNCDATVTFSPASGSFFNVGTTTVTATATDSSNNTSSCTFDVVVNDDTPPTFLTTESHILYLDTNGVATFDTGSFNASTVTDNCGIQNITFDKTTFNCDERGFHTINATATDVNGNTTVGQVNIEVRDEIAPTVITQDLTIELDTNGNASITTEMINNNSTDNCSIASYSLDNTDFNCNNLGDNTVELTVTDINGNSATANATVTVVDNIAPTVITQNISVTLMNGSASISPNDIDGGTFDNCSFDLSINNSSFTCDDIGDHTVTLTATDSSGNTSSNTATVSVLGDVPIISIADFTAVQTQNTNTIYLGFGSQNATLNTTTTGGSGFTYEWTTSTGEIVDNVANPIVSPTVSTTYNVTVTNSNGCRASTSIDVCVIDARAYDKKGRYKGKVLVCHHTNGKKGTKHVQISISPNAVMQHLSNHGVGTNHADSLGACNAECIPNLNYKTSTKVKETNTIESKLIYPNPSNGVFTIKINASKTDTNILLFDVSGKLVDSKTITKDNNTQNISVGRHNLSAGVYLLRIISDNETVTKKLIVKKN